MGPSFTGHHNELLSNVNYPHPRNHDSKLYSTAAPLIILASSLFDMAEWQDMFEQAVIDAFKDIINWVVSGLTSSFGESFIKMVIEILVWTPTPDRPGMWTEPTGPVWGTIWEFSHQMSEFAAVILVIGSILFLGVHALSLNGYAIEKFGSNLLIASGVIFGGPLYLELIIGFLQLVDAITQFFFPSPQEAASAFASSMAVGAIQPMLALFTLLFVGLILLLVLMISIIRIAGLLVLIVLVPLIAAMWAFGVGPLRPAGQWGRKGAYWLFGLAMFPIVPAVTFGIGVKFMALDSPPIPGVAGDDATSQMAALLLGFAFITVGTLGGVMMTRLGKVVVEGGAKVGTAAAATYVAGPKAGALILSKNAQNYHGTTNSVDGQGLQGQLSMNRPGKAMLSGLNPQDMLSRFGSSTTPDIEQTPALEGRGYNPSALASGNLKGLPEPEAEPMDPVPGAEDDIVDLHLTQDATWRSHQDTDGAWRTPTNVLERRRQGAREVRRTTASNTRQTTFPDFVKKHSTPDSRADPDTLVAHTDGNERMEPLEAEVIGVDEVERDTDLNEIEIEGADPQY